MTKKQLKSTACGEPSGPTPELDDAMMAELKEWGLAYWLAVYKYDYPDRPADEVRRMAEAAAERDPGALGFFLPREERERLLALGLDHFQIETYAILKCLRPCRCRRWR